MLDAQFVNSNNAGEVSLGGRCWTLVKCDEGLNMVIVVPGGGSSSRVFWTGGSEDGFSPLICRAVQKIRSRGTASLPLGEREQELLQLARALGHWVARDWDALNGLVGARSVADEAEEELANALAAAQSAQRGAPR